MNDKTKGGILIVLGLSAITLAMGLIDYRLGILFGGIFLLILGAIVSS